MPAGPPYPRPENNPHRQEEERVEKKEEEQGEGENGERALTKRQDTESWTSCRLPTLGIVVSTAPTPTPPAAPAQLNSTQLEPLHAPLELPKIATPNPHRRSFA